MTEYVNNKEKAIEPRLWKSRQIKKQVQRSNNEYM